MPLRSGHLSFLAMNNTGCATRTIKSCIDKVATSHVFKRQVQLFWSTITLYCIDDHFFCETVTTTTETRWRVLQRRRRRFESFLCKHGLECQSSLDGVGLRFVFHPLYHKSSPNDLTRLWLNHLRKRTEDIDFQNALLFLLFSKGGGRGRNAGRLGHTHHK